MRRLADRERIRSFLEELGRASRSPANIYLVGGATAVLEGWRESTIDIDLEIVPESDEILRAIPDLKRELEVNVELAAPHHFIPELPGWQDRSEYLDDFGPLTVYQYDLYSQALSKIERGHAQDREDVQRMLSEGLVEPERLRELFTAIEPELHRYPAVDAESFRQAVEEALASSEDR